MLAYMDDVIVFSESWEDHEFLVRQVLGALRAAGFTANLTVSVGWTAFAYLRPCGRPRQSVSTSSETSSDSKLCQTNNQRD